MRKNIHFYRLILEKTTQLNLFENTDITFKSKIENFIKNYDTTDLLQINNKNIFTIVSIDRSHIFGTFGNVSDAIKGDYVRGRNKKDFTVEGINNLLEIYTYYYLDLETLNIAVLQNSKLADFKSPFKSFISSHFRVSAIFDEIKVVPLLSSDIPNDFGKTSSLLSVKTSYVTNRLPDNEFVNVKEILGMQNNDIQSASLYVTLRKDFKKKLNFNLFQKDDYSEFKVETESESIDLIEGIITKKISVDVSKDELNDDDMIKLKLKESLLAVDGF
ncbi:MAG: hypothetical protein RR494_13675 [Vagococcus sp.]|uniref:hypothetical protein n=1 Tax=Vagococcus sp. TaxID=1933889 RepID=UPI002FC5DF9E